MKVTGRVGEEQRATAHSAKPPRLSSAATLKKCRGAGISMFSRNFSPAISWTTQRGRIVLPIRPEQWVFTMHSELRFPISTQTFNGKPPMPNSSTRSRPITGPREDFLGLLRLTEESTSRPWTSCACTKISEHWGVADLFSLLQQTRRMAVGRGKMTDSRTIWPRNSVRRPTTSQRNSRLTSNDP